MLKHQYYRIIAILVLAATITSLAPQLAEAITYNKRRAWMFGVGFGYGRGVLTGSDGVETDYRTGASPHIRLGRFVSKKFMLSANYEGWLVELGEEPLKFRRILQNLVLAASFYPGKEGTALSGYYVRAGAGMGWAGTGAKKAEQDEPQHKGNRIDEWGTGVFFETGYEFWVAPDATVGLSFVLNGFSINETIVDTAWFSAGVINLNLYF